MLDSPLSLVDMRISPENIITKSNVLIESNYRLSTLESKLILTLFSNVQPSDQDLNTYIFPIKPFADLLELKGKSIYKDLQTITKGLMDKSFEIKIDDELYQVSWLSFVKYNERQGTITLRFDPFWKPYILQLQQNFTSYKLGNITKLKSSYSIRLYELLKQRQGLKTRTLYIEELRQKLGVPEDAYPRYANFKQRVLITAQRELLEGSDIAFDFSEIKKGRAVEKIKFEIHNNAIIRPVLESSPPQKELDLLRELLLLGLAKNEAEKLMSLFPEERIRENLAYTNERVKKGRVKQPAAYLKRAIEQDFAKTKLSTPVPKIEVIPKWMNKQEENINITTPAEKETFLLEAIDLMKSLGNSDEKILHDVTVMLRKYQEEYLLTYGQPVHTSDFNDPYIQQICEVIEQEFYIKG